MRPSGFGLGALAGQHPAPALGLVPSAGVVLWDEFLLGAGDGVASRFGDRLWTSDTLGGSAPTHASQTPTSATEVGIHRLTTAASANSGGVLRLGSVAPFATYPPTGSVWACKIRLQSGSSDYQVWSGFSDAADRVAGAVSNDFLGVRGGGGNWFGVARNGTAEHTVDLGLAVGTTWVVLGFEVTASGVQFFTLDLSDTGIWERTNRGSPVIVDLPNTPTTPTALGLYTTNATAKAAEIDWWALGGRTAR